MSGRRIDDAFLTEIARQYAEHVAARRMPAPAIAETETAPVRTVHRWIYEARKRGLLSPGTPAGLCGGKVPPRQPGPAGERVAANVRSLRETRGLTVRSLSEALGEAGHPLNRWAVAKIEQLERHVTVDDLAALATVLKTTPQRLLNSPDACATCGGFPPAGFSCRSCGAEA
ncbi:helix-turn-helix domain-containing protein [Streptomyces sp. NBC_01613]|uniref:helix-turn-helix domain-containing protein n=1 Tax=Streptomyces sp. NBC_01613 TaxID=2975896 RepID=UPI00386FC27C